MFWRPGIAAKTAKPTTSSHGVHLPSAKKIRLIEPRTTALRVYLYGNPPSPENWLYSVRRVSNLLNITARRALRFKDRTWLPIPTGSNPSRMRDAKRRSFREELLYLQIYNYHRCYLDYGMGTFITIPCWTARKERESGQIHIVAKQLPQELFQSVKQYARIHKKTFPCRS